MNAGRGVEYIECYGNCGHLVINKLPPYCDVCHPGNGQRRVWMKYGPNPYPQPKPSLGGTAMGWTITIGMGGVSEELTVGVPHDEWESCPDRAVRCPSYGGWSTCQKDSPALAAMWGRLEEFHRKNMSVLGFWIPVIPIHPLKDDILHAKSLAYGPSEAAARAHWLIECCLNAIAQYGPDAVMEAPGEWSVGLKLDDCS